MAVQCPRCGKPEIKTRTGLRKHLTGGAASGGHDVTFELADREATAVWEGAPVQSALPTVPAAEVVAAMTALSDTGAAHYLRVLLAGLVADKQLPKYQFERRVDALLTPFLPAIVSRALGGGTASVVVPEFPIKKPGSNQSTNADHLLLVRDRPDGAPDCWVLFELKTDAGSYDPLQAEIYRLAQRDGWSRLRADVATIRDASSKKAGYTSLLQRLDGQAGDDPPEVVAVVYLTPTSVPPYGFHSVHFNELLGMDIGVHREVWNLLRTLVLPALT
jgi:hypothetical protein